MPIQILERSPDHKFTHQYSQPEEYHFCWDSVIFARFVAQNLRATGRLLDLCAGCGVIGLELAHHLPEIRVADFVEIQDIYREHFARNVAMTGHQNFRFLNMNYENLLQPEFAGRYDLIVCNPPYFFPEDGKIGPSEIKNRSRFFIDSNLETLIRATVHALAEDGEAYLLAKPGERHGRDSISQITKIAADLGREANTLANIRGTHVVFIN